MDSIRIRLPHPYILGTAITAIIVTAGVVRNARKENTSGFSLRFRPQFNSGIRLPKLLHFFQDRIRQADQETVGLSYISLLSQSRTARIALGLIADEDDHGTLSTTVFNKQFKHPIGISAGFDKNGEAIDGLFSLGCSFIELGTVTPQGQGGPEPPRLVQFHHSKSLLNFLGYNNYGFIPCIERIADYFSSRGLSQYDRQLGVNIHVNQSSPDEFHAHKYMDMVESLAPYASYVVVNVDPAQVVNTTDNSLHVKHDFTQFLTQLNLFRQTVSDTIVSSFPMIIAKKFNVAQIEFLRKEQHYLSQNDIVKMDNKTRLLLKIPCDTPPILGCKLIDTIQDTGCDGIVIGGPITNFHGMIDSKEHDIAMLPTLHNGSISGELIKDQATTLIGTLFHYSQGKVPIIGSGGVFTGKDAFEKIRAGASLVQVHTAIYTDGVDSPFRIRQELQKEVDLYNTELENEYHHQLSGAITTPELFDAVTHQALPQLTGHRPPTPTPPAPPSRVTCLDPLIGIDSERYYNETLAAYSSELLASLKHPPQLLLDQQQSTKTRYYAQPSINLLKRNTLLQARHPLQDEADQFHLLHRDSHLSTDRRIQKEKPKIVHKQPTSIVSPTTYSSSSDDLLQDLIQSATMNATNSESDHNSGLVPPPTSDV